MTMDQGSAPARVEGLVAGELTLAECPPGLFLTSDCGLCFKSEYGDNNGRIDAYIVSSGEFFWGAAPQTIDSQRRQIVRPVDLTTLQQELAAKRALHAERDAADRDHLAAYQGSIVRREEAEARATAAEAKCAKLRGAVEFVLDGFGLDGPDYKIDHEDLENMSDEDEALIRKCMWIIDRLRAALAAKSAGGGE
jgi:hypothetical protein